MSNENVDRQDEDPMNLKHMKLIRIMMLSVGNWPEQAVKGVPRKIPYYTLYLIVETTILTLGQYLYLLKLFHELTFFVLGNILITLSLSLLVIVRGVYSVLGKYGEIFRRFLHEFHLRHFRNNDEHAEEVYQKVDRVSTYFTIYMTTLSLSGVITFNVAPVYTNYRAGLFRDDPPENMTLEISIHYQYPGFRQEEHFVLTALLNVWFSFVCAFMITIMDLFLCLIVFQIIGHIIYLKTVLKHFPRPSETTYQCAHPDQKGGGSERLVVETIKHFNDDENKIIKEKIMACVNHHRIIVSFTEDISDFFGPLLAINYTYHLFSFSILLVECLQGGDAIMHYGSLTLMTLAQLTQLSTIFEIVHSESVKLIDEVYFIPWESMSVSNQKSVCFFLSRVQIPIAVTAMGMTAVGVQTMASILKTTFSYCAFLKSFG